MKNISRNCRQCLSYINNKCDGEDDRCMCKKCPRNLGECIITRYCRETESVLEFDE